AEVFLDLIGADVVEGDPGVLSILQGDNGRPRGLIFEIGSAQGERVGVKSVDELGDGRRVQRYPWYRGGHECTFFEGVDPGLGFLRVPVGPAGAERNHGVVPFNKEVRGALGRYALPLPAPSTKRGPNRKCAAWKANANMRCLPRMPYSDRPLSLGTESCLL